MAGSVVNIASVSGVVGQDDAPAYQAAKAGSWPADSQRGGHLRRPADPRQRDQPIGDRDPGLASRKDERTARFLARVPMGRPGTPARTLRPPSSTSRATAPPTSPAPTCRSTAAT